MKVSKYRPDGRAVDQPLWDELATWLTAVHNV
jgi:hypothetical protein